MFRRPSKLAPLIIVGGIAAGCAQIKEAGRTIGHTTRDVTREIGHGARHEDGLERAVAVPPAPQRLGHGLHELAPQAPRRSRTQVVAAQGRDGHSLRSASTRAREPRAFRCPSPRM